MIINIGDKPEAMINFQIIVGILKDHTMTANLVCKCGFDYGEYLPDDYGEVYEYELQVNGIESYIHAERDAEIYNNVYLTHQAEEIAKYLHP